MRPLALVLLSILFFGCTSQVVVTESPPQETEQNISEVIIVSSDSDPRLEQALPYLSPILLSDKTLLDSARAITRSCPADDNDCAIHSLYRYVVDTFHYRSDPAGEELIRPVRDTISSGGGDCEDLSILLNSYLEQLDITTYLVLAQEHAYTLACGVDTDRLSELITKQFLNQLEAQLDATQPLKVYEKGNSIYLQDISDELSFTMKPGEVIYYGGDGDNLDGSFTMLDLSFSLTSRYPLTVYIVPSKEDFRNFAQAKTFSYYPQCVYENKTFEKNQCKGLKKAGGIMLVNPTLQPTNVRFKYEFSYLLSPSLLSDLMADTKISFYTIKGEKCIVLDPTAGEHGYPGYDGNVTGSKYAVNVRTHEIVELV